MDLHMLRHSNTVLYNSKSKVDTFAQIGTLTTEKVAAGCPRIGVNKCLYLCTDTWASAILLKYACKQACAPQADCNVHLQCSITNQHKSYTASYAISW